MKILSFFRASSFFIQVAFELILHELNHSSAVGAFVYLLRYLTAPTSYLKLSVPHNARRTHSGCKMVSGLNFLMPILLNQYQFNMKIFLIYELSSFLVTDFKKEMYQYHHLDLNLILFAQ